MPRCRECGEQHRSYKALETHWQNQHQEKFQEQNSRKDINGRKLAVTNLIQHWKNQVTV